MPTMFSLFFLGTIWKKNKQTIERRRIGCLLGVTACEKKVYLLVKRKYAYHAQVCGDLWQGWNSVQSIDFLQIKENLLQDLHMSIPKINKNFRDKWEAQVMTWGGCPKYHSNKRWPLGSPGALRNHARHNLTPKSPCKDILKNMPKPYDSLCDYS